MFGFLFIRRWEENGLVNRLKGYFGNWLRAIGFPNIYCLHTLVVKRKEKKEELPKNKAGE